MALKKKKDADNMSFLEHLEVLRWHLIRCTIAVLIGSIIAFFLKGFIFDTILFGPKKPDFFTYRLLCTISEKLGINEICINGLNFVLQTRSMAGQFSAHIWMAIWIGLVLAFPYILYEVWRFIAPGLYPKERTYARGFISVSSALFFMGVLFGYYVICPFSVSFLTNYQVSNEIVNNIDLSSYISLMVTSVLSCGLVFELPIIIYFLAKLGLVTPQILRKYRKHALIVVLIIAAVITPPDVTSQIIVSIPIAILYEASIFIAGYVVRAKKKEEQAS